MSELEQEMRELAALHGGRKVGDVALDTRLLTDLAIDGDDADALMKEVAKRYPQVDFSSLVWVRHFHDEGADYVGPGLALLLMLHPGFRQRWNAARAAEREITPGHLARVIEAGHWYDMPAPATPRAHVGLGAMIFSLVLLILFSAAGGVLVFAALGARGLPPAIAVWLALIGLIFFVGWRGVKRLIAAADL